MIALNTIEIEDFSEWETLLEKRSNYKFSHQLEERDRQSLFKADYHQTDPAQDFIPEEKGESLEQEKPEWLQALEFKQQEEWKCSLWPFEAILSLIGDVQPIRTKKASSKPRQRAMRASLKLKNNPAKMEIAGMILGILYSPKRWHQISQKRIAQMTGHKLATVNRVFISLVEANIIVKFNNYYNVKEQVALTYRLSNQFICEESTLEKERIRNQEITDTIKVMMEKLLEERKSIEKAIEDDKKKRNRRIGLMKKLKLQPLKLRLCPACDRYKQGFDFNIIKEEGTLSDSCTECIKTGNGIRHLKLAL